MIKITERPVLSIESYVGDVAADGKVHAQGRGNLRCPQCNNDLKVGTDEKGVVVEPVSLFCVPCDGVLENIFSSVQDMKERVNAVVCKQLGADSIDYATHEFGGPPPFRFSEEK